MNRHLTSDELISRLYGIGDSAAESHLWECDECTKHYHAFQARRFEAAEPSVSSGDLSAQRRAIYARIDASEQAQPRWAPAVAAGLLLVMGVVLYGPLTQIAETRMAERPAPIVRTEISDEQLFSDVYSMEESVEPRAAAPIQGLFEPDVSVAGDETQP